MTSKYYKQKDQLQRVLVDKRAILLNDTIVVLHDYNSPSNTAVKIEQRINSSIWEILQHLLF